MSGPDYPPVPSVAQIEFLCEIGGVYGGIEFQYELYWEDSLATRDYAYLKALANDSVAAWGAAGGIKDYANDDVTLTKCRAIDLDSVVHLTADSDAGDVAAGGDSACLPLTVCAVVRIPNAEGGAPRRPYVRYGPIAEAAVAGNQIEAASRTQIADAFMATIAALEASQPNGSLVVVSVYEPKATGGGTPATLYRDAGVPKQAVSDALSVRPLVGRAASRQK